MDTSGNYYTSYLDENNETQKFKISAKQMDQYHNTTQAEIQDMGMGVKEAINTLVDKNGNLLPRWIKAADITITEKTENGNTIKTITGVFSKEAAEAFNLSVKARALVNVKALSLRNQKDLALQLGIENYNSENESDLIKKLAAKTYELILKDLGEDPRYHRLDITSQSIKNKKVLTKTAYFATPKIAEALSQMQNKILNDTYFSDGGAGMINLKRQGKLGDSTTRSYYFTKNNDGKILISTSQEDIENGQAKPRDTFDPGDAKDVIRAKEEFGIDIVPTFSVSDKPVGRVKSGDFAKNWSF
jgi:hypothetical protein